MSLHQAGTPREGLSLLPARPWVVPRLFPGSLPSAPHLGLPVEIAELRRPFPPGRDAAEGGEGGEGGALLPSCRATECLLSLSRPSSAWGPRSDRVLCRCRGGHAAGRPPFPGNALPSPQMARRPAAEGGPGGGARSSVKRSATRRAASPAPSGSDPVSEAAWRDLAPGRGWDVLVATGRVGPGERWAFPRRC